MEHKLEDIQELTQIEKGFSIEKKYWIKTGRDELLLRVTPLRLLDRKKLEFDVMRTLHSSGVNCNKPIDIFSDEQNDSVFSLFHYLPGQDAEETIQEFDEKTQYAIGFQAGQDLKRINRLVNDSSSWKQRKLAKHKQYLDQYLAQDYRFDNDDKVIQFIELNFDSIGTGVDRLQHDDFHLGNIVIADGNYGGILDFNRFDWGDPLHEFVKLEWFTWPVSRAFARGEIQGYFGENGIDRQSCLTISVYVAMSIISTVVWTMKFHPETMQDIEKRLNEILASYECFERVEPEWTAR